MNIIDAIDKYDKVHQKGKPYYLMKNKNNELICNEKIGNRAMTLPMISSLDEWVEYKEIKEELQ